jgi:outer membrane protein assembly factor BamB
MNFAKNKANVTIAMLTIAVLIAAVLPAVYAHDPPWEIPTYAFITVSPNPIGIGQTTTVVYWLDKIPPGSAGVAGERWIGWTLEVTEPDETKETISLGTSDPVGGGWLSYTPDQVGTYTFKLNFPGQVITGSTGSGIYNYNIAINDTYSASSATTTLTVQQEPIAGPPSYPLPTEYWTRPIEGQNTEWYRVASNWLGSPQIVAKFQAEGAAPNSAHIMWTKPISFGGVVGGNKTEIPSVTFYSGLAYEVKATNAIIMYGRLYYSLPRSNDAYGNGVVCVDLTTGEELWINPNIQSFSFGQLYDYESMNQHGVIPNGYLWQTSGTTWSAYDPLTGNWLFNETNVPLGIVSPYGIGAGTVYGPNGEMLYYTLNAAGKWLALWNNTAAHGLTGARSPTDTTSSDYYTWRPVGKNVDMSQSYSWNVTLPWLPTGATIVRAIYGDILLGMNGSLPTIGSWDPYTMWAISLKPETRGQLLWIKNYAAPAGNITLIKGPVDPVNRVFTLYYKETMQWEGYSIDTGELLWGPTESEPAGNYYCSPHLSAGLWEFQTVAYGNLYVGGYSGELRCYDTANGKLKWVYNNTLSYLGYPWERYPLCIAAIGDGKVYLYVTEHSPNAPPYKDIKMRCVNATDGSEIWALLGWGAAGATSGYTIADGYFVYHNLLDMQMYCIGKGPSVMTLSASPKVSVHGSSVLVEGTVVDIAAGTRQDEQAARFPNGVPAVSDESQSEWMEYVYMQKPKPTDVTGVEVVIEVLDPNNNYYEVGRTTSDANSLFHCAFTPEVPGEYTIIATFEGSESYWPSYAETAINVEEAPEPTPAPTPTPAPMTDMYVIGFGSAAFIAIIIGFVILILLRKR